MLFKQHILDGIAEGKVTLAFRCWKRQTVKAGGTLQTPAGLLSIKSVEVVGNRAITTVAAKKAGFDSKEQLLDSLGKRDGNLYRIRFERVGDDPRIALRNDDVLSNDDLCELQTRLARLDARSKFGPWTTKVLKLIAQYPEQRAAELAARSNYEKEWLKTNIRKLKNLGLTESLDVGYRLSPRGDAYMRLSKID